MTLSLKRLTLLVSVLVLLAVLSAAGAAFLFVNDLATSGAARSVAISARLLAANVAAIVANEKAEARRLAARAAALGLLKADKTSERAAFLQATPATAPVLKIRLLPAGAHDTEDGVPALSYVCLDMLARSEQGKPVPDAEYHLPNTPSAHVDVFARVQDPSDQRVLGHVLLSLDPSALRSALSVLQPADGYAELRQPAPGGEPVVIATAGDAGLKRPAPGIVQPVAGTAWQIVFWAPSTSVLPALGTLMTSAALALLALVFVTLSVVLPQRGLRSALRHDGELLVTLLNDVRSGVLMGQYPFRLQEFGRLAAQLRPVGEAMIEDRRSLERMAQSDALTGLVARPAFEAKLAHLHTQTHTGFTSALLVTEIDHLEEINTQIGVEAGDILLKQFSRQLRETLRQSDVVARLEGGRFGVLFAFTDLDKIQPVVERLRQRLAEEFDPGSGLPRAYSWSAGLTLLANSDTGPESAMTRAEAALQTARQQGGNRTVTFAAPG